MTLYKKNNKKNYYISLCCSLVTILNAYTIILMTFILIYKKRITLSLKFRIV